MVSRFGSLRNRNVHGEIIMAERGGFGNRGLRNPEIRSTLGVRTSGITE